MTATAQTSYAQEPADQGYPGMLADGGEQDVATYRNDESTDMPLGIMLAQSATAGKDTGAKLVASATDKLIGVLVQSMSRSPGKSDFEPKAPIPVLREGRCFVKVEQAVTTLSDVYVRFAASAVTTDGTQDQKGQFRKDADGVAHVVTVTPTATNSAVYLATVSIRGKNYTFEYQADGSATAAEIVTGLKAAMAANAEFTALVVATGTNTLILTGQTVGETFTFTNAGDGVLTPATTTPGAPTAVKVKGARFLDTASAGGVARVEFDVLDNRT